MSAETCSIEGLPTAARITASDALGLYLHIPFCSAICGYCNFNRILFNESSKDAYLTAIELEVRKMADGSSVNSVHFGGGTPSLLLPEEVGRLVAACRDSFNLASDTEITLEANPESLTIERLAGYRQAGITRLSIGVQSFLNEELARLDRTHTASDAESMFRTARREGFDNLSLDLMMWLPGQTLVEWQTSVDAALALAPDHVSLYLLELYSSAPLQAEMARQGWSRVPDDDAADMYLDAMERFEEAGYQQYEISNVACPGKRSQHNLKYWTDGSWIGFGCGAHSTRGNLRWHNVSSVDEYVVKAKNGVDFRVDQRMRSVEECWSDALIMGLRLVDGVDLDIVEKRYEIDVRGQYGSALRPFLDVGVLVEENRRLRLTRQGMLVANEIMSVFV